MNPTILMIIYIAAGILLLWLFFYFIPIGHYFKAKTEGVKISLAELTAMNSRKAPLGEIVDALILSEKGNLGITQRDLELAALTGCDIQAIVQAMLLAKNAGLEVSFKQAMQAELDS